MSFVFASGRMHQQMNFWRPQEKEYPLTGTSDLLLLFIACAAVAPRSYIPEPNELGPTDTTFAPRSLRERKSCWGTPGKRRLCTDRDGQSWPCSNHTDNSVLLSFGRQGGIGQVTLQLGRKPKDTDWRSKVGDDGCLQSWWSLCWFGDADWEVEAGAVSSDHLQQRLEVCSCNLCIPSEGLEIWISNVK